MLGSSSYFSLLLLQCVCDVHVCGHMCLGMCVEIRDHLWRAESLHLCPGFRNWSDISRPAWSIFSLLSFLLYIQCRLLDQRVVWPTFRLSLPLSVNPLWNPPPPVMPRNVAMAILNAVKLTVKTNHHTLVANFIYTKRNPPFHLDPSVSSSFLPKLS